MKPLIIIVGLFLSLHCAGQSQFKIDYPFPIDTVINNLDTLGKEIVFNIDFIDKSGHVVKNRERLLMENHHTKRGYNITDKKTYYFYKDSLLLFDLDYYFTSGKISKTEYAYNEFGKLLATTYYSYPKSLKGDTLLRFKNEDYYLNNPDKIPKENWEKNTVFKRAYSPQGKIIYKGYFRQAKVKAPISADREDYFIYNDKQQLIEHTSLSRTDYESNLMQTFEYDCEGKMIKRNWYEDGRYQAFDLIRYTDSIIYRKSYFFNTGPGQSGYGNVNPYSRSSESNATLYKYIFDNKTKKYLEEKWNNEFKICSDTE